jgi:hypothetical protein
MKWADRRLPFLLAVLPFLLAFLSSRVGIHDWGKELYFSEITAQSLKASGELPAVVWELPEELKRFPVFQATRIFWAVPETLLFSPLSLFLHFLDPARYIYLHVLLFLALGFWGFLKLSQQQAWNAEQNFFFACCFFMSPMVLQHLAMGYTPWLLFSAISWFFVFLLDDNYWRSSLGLALLLSVFLLLGGLHPFVLFSAALGLQALAALIFNKEEREFTFVRLPVIYGVVVLLSLSRLWPSQLAFKGFSQELLTGYTPKMFFKFALTPPWTWGSENFTHRIYENIATWDAGVFWGLPLLVLPLAFCCWKRIREERALLAAALVLAVLSFGDLWGDILAVFPRALSTRIASAEKYPYRFMLPAYYFVVVALTMSFPHWKKLLPVPLKKALMLLVFLPLLWTSLQWTGVLLSRPSQDLRRTAAQNPQNYQALKLDGLDKSKLEIGANDLLFLEVNAEGRELRFRSQSWKPLLYMSWLGMLLLGLFLGFRWKRFFFKLS